MMLSTVNTAANNGNLRNNTAVMYHDEENVHITECQLKPNGTTENDPSTPNRRKTEKSTKYSTPITHSADITSTSSIEKIVKNTEKMLEKAVEASSPLVDTP